MKYLSFAVLEEDLRIILSLLILLSFSSCSLKEAVDNGFKTKTSVEPLAQSKTLAQRYGDGKYINFTLKIPLSENSIGYYDVEDVLGNRNLNSKQKSFFNRLYDRFKLKLYNLAVRFGFANKLKFSSTFSFPQIDSRFIKSAVVKKIFFTTEDCRHEEEDCNDRNSLGSNFNLVDTFFVNVSSIRPSQIESTDSEPIELSDDDFASAQQSAFNQTQEKRKENLQKSAEEANEEDDRSINLVKYANATPEVDLHSIEFSENEDGSMIRLHVKKNKKYISNYLKGEKFKHLISEVRSGFKRGFKKGRRRKKIKGIEVYLKDGALSSDVMDIIKGERSLFSQKMFIFRLKSHFIKTKKYFENEKFKHLVKDTTMIGKSLYVEVRDGASIGKFEKMLENEKGNFNSLLFSLEPDRCQSQNCLDLKVNNINLVPLIERDPNIRIDTFLSVKTLGAGDFKYNGFIEVEIVLDLPL